MSNTDSFIEEVTEEVQKDKLFGLIRRYGWIAVLAVVLLVGGAGYFEWQRTQAEAAAQALGDQVLTALETEEGDPRAAAIAAIDPPPEAEPVIALLQAAERQATDDPEAAAAALKSVVDSNTAPALYRDIAALKLVLLAPESLSAEARDDMLANLAIPGAPFRHLAVEQQVYVALQSGDAEGAVTKARSVLEETGISQGVRQRLENLILSLGEEVDPG